MRNKDEIEYHCKYDELIDPSKLIDHPHNCNTHPRRQLDALVAYIRQTGWRHKVVVSKRSGYIVVGHGRKIAGIEIGCLVPVEYQDFADEAEERLHLAADNKLAELAEIKLDKLEIEVMELAQLDIPVFDFGFGNISSSETKPSNTEKPKSKSKISMDEIRCFVREDLRMDFFETLRKFAEVFGDTSIQWQKT